MAGAIDWIRWLAYLVAGVPLFAWLFLTRDRVLRTVGVVGITFFLQDTFAGRRYFFGLSLGPSLAAAYVALMAVAIERRRPPQLGAYGIPVFGLLFCALIGVVIGTTDTNTLQFNLKQLQFNFLEGFVFFLFALSALRTGDELVRFFRWFVAIGLGTAFFHLVSIGTGYRFRGGGEEVAGANFGGVLTNPNSLGSFFAMCIPVTLSIAMDARTPRQVRLFCRGVLVVMAGSVILSGSRGGMIFSLIGCAIAGMIARVGAGRMIVALLGAAILGAVGFQATTMLLADSWSEVAKGLREEGLQTDRWVTFLGYSRAILNHPIGVGLTPPDFQRAVAEVGLVGVSSAHNIYLDMGIQCGIPGLAFFVALLALLLLRNRRASRLTRDAATREGLRYAFLALVGYSLVGFFEPIYLVDTKLNNLFWLLAGLSAGASSRVIAEARQPVEVGGEDRDALVFASHAPRA